MIKYKKFFKKLMSFNLRATPVILQLSETECGIASLAMVLSHYNVNLSLESLREKCGVSRDGCKAQTLITVAKSYGFHGDAYKVDIKDIPDFALPVIAYWNFNHYIVIKKVRSKKVYVNDPAHGALAINMAEFDKAFTGIIICLTPSNAVKTIKIKSTLLNTILHWFAGYYKELNFIFVCLLMIGFIPYLTSLSYNLFTDECLVGKNRLWIPFIILFTLLISVMFVSFGVINKKVQFKLYSKASLFKSAEVLSHMLQLPMLFFSLRQRSEIVAILARVESVINLLFKNTLDFLLGSITLLLSFLCMMELNVSLSLISLFTTVAASIMFYVIAKTNYSYEKANINIAGKWYSHSMSSIRNIETIKACSLEPLILAKCNDTFSKKIQVQDKVNALGILLNAIEQAANLISTFSILCFGGYQISKGAISLGNLMGYYSIHLIFYTSMSHLFQVFKNSQNVLAAHTRIADINSYPKDARFYKSENKSQRNEVDYMISLSNLTFYYNLNSLPILANININIKSDQHIALVGGTGSGKSTLAKVICGFYQPNEGEIIFLGRELSCYSADEIANACAYVSQNSSLLSGTILENINLSNKDINPDEIYQAINNACLNDLIENRKLTGIVEEEGRNFSGGEKQRIDIARALVQDTPILVLDEATSALDVQTEQKLINNLRKIPKTIIFVAHRLSTIEHCDQIIVMDKGRIIEQGNHQQLIKTQGYYYSLIKKDINSKSLTPCH